MARHVFRNRLGELVEIPAVAASQAKNSFGELIDRVATAGERLDALSAKFEGLLERLQTPPARDGLEAAFHATPEKLGRAAVEAARRRR